MANWVKIVDSDGKSLLKIAEDGSASVTLVGRPVQHDLLVVNLAKRDTTTITTQWIPIIALTKRFWVYTTLDQGFDLISQWSYDGGTTVIQAGNAATYAANSGFTSRMETDANLLGLRQLGGYIRFLLTFSVAPTTGTLSLGLEQAGL